MNLSSVFRCSRLWPQWLAAIELCMITFNAGLVGSWASPYLAKLNAIYNPKSELPLNNVESSWIASLPHLARPFGAILGGILLHIIGTKLSMLLTGVTFTLGWLCFFVTGSLPLVYASRVVSGIGVGMVFSVSPLYIGEIAHPKIRGALVVLTIEGFIIGIMWGSIMGKYLSLRIFAAVSLAPCVIFLISFGVMPQTPYHLVRSNKMEEAAKSILFYDRNAHVNDQLNILKTFLKINKLPTFLDILRELTSPVNRRILFIVNFISILGQISGGYVFASYMEIMLLKAHVDIIEPSTLVIIASFISIITSLLGMLTYDKYGRTGMLFGSCIGTAFAIFLMALNYLLLDFDYGSPNLQWLFIASMTLYKITSSLGLTAVPSALTSEMFAPNIKGIGSAIRSSVIGLSAFAATKFYQPLVDVLTEKYLFFIYALILVFLAVYTIKCVPETKGKSLPEIQEILSKRIGTKSNNDS